METENLAIVDETIQPPRGGRIRFRGSFGFARCEKNITLQPGELVRVVSLDRSQITYGFDSGQWGGWNIKIIFLSRLEPKFSTKFFLN